MATTSLIRVELIFFNVTTKKFFAKKVRKSLQLLLIEYRRALPFFARLLSTVCAYLEQGNTDGERYFRSPRNNSLTRFATHQHQTNLLTL